MKAILIDDEELSVEALKRRVNWAHYGIEEVLIANSAEDAKKMFKENRIDLMLSDIEMPGSSGLTLFEWVKTHYPLVKCVYVTCHPEYEYMRKALQLGSADYILKPIDYEELDRILTKLVSGCSGTAAPEHTAPLHKEMVENHPSSEVIATVKRYIHDHIQETIYVSELAGEVFLNEQYLMRLFKKVEGVSLMEYITAERLRVAQNLLSTTDYPIHRVAGAAGYVNYSYFTRIFKREIGMTPLKYRQKNC